MTDRLVLLPGMDGTGDLFAGLASALPSSFQPIVVAYPKDKPLSSSALLVTVQAAVPAKESYVLVAESFSTPLAIAFAAGNPAGLKGLILCAGFVTSPLRGLRRQIALLLAPMLFHLPLSRFFVEAFLTGPETPDALLHSVRRAITSVKPSVLASRLRTVLGCDARAELARIRVPVLYVQASQDRLIPMSCLDEILQRAPGVSVARIAGPHLILQREPHQAADAIIHFLKTHP